MMLHAGTGGLVAAWLAWSTSGWLAALALVVAGGLLWRIRRAPPHAELRYRPGESGVRAWSWREHSRAEWQELSLQCDYLGPWLIGLRGNKRRLWLWPDSSDPERLRALRRALASSGEQSG